MSLAVMAHTTYPAREVHLHGEDANILRTRESVNVRVEGGRGHLGLQKKRG
jgi:hypothetical protein